MTTLFINACVREDSRTLTLAHHLLKYIPGEIRETDLGTSGIRPLVAATLAERETAKETDPESPVLSYARDFAEADTVVIAAPLWDLSVPAVLKCWIEHICVTGITFDYVNGVPSGRCNARRLYFVTTCGGSFIPDHSFGYVKALAESFFGIPECICYAAEGLDIGGADIQAILKEAMAEIDAKEG